MNKGFCHSHRDHPPDRVRDRVARAHLADVVARIDAILDGPNARAGGSGTGARAALGR